MNNSDKDDSLPFQVDEDRWGQVLSFKKCCPGVYEVDTDGNGIFHSTMYVISDNYQGDAISAEALSYGTHINGMVYFEYEDACGGWEIIQYEIARYWRKHGIIWEDCENIEDIAFLAAELYPAYFGEYPPPVDTPCGRMLRYRRLYNGIFFLDTAQGKWMLALSYHIWSCCLSSTAQHVGRQTSRDRTMGIDKTMGYLFFSRETCGVAFFELLWQKEYDILKEFITSEAALHASIWRNCPRYAILSAYLDSKQGECGRLATRIFEEIGLSPPKRERISQYVVPFDPDVQETEFLIWPDPD